MINLLGIEKKNYTMDVLLLIFSWNKCNHCSLRTVQHQIDRRFHILRRTRNGSSTQQLDVLDIDLCAPAKLMQICSYLLARFVNFLTSWIIIMVKKGGQEKRSTLTREEIENCHVTSMNLISSFLEKVISNQTAYFWTTNICYVFILIVLNYL